MLRNPRRLRNPRPRRRLRMLLLPSCRRPWMSDTPDATSRKVAGAGRGPGRRPLAGSRRGPGPGEGCAELLLTPGADPPASKPTEDASQGSLVTIPNVGKSRLFGEDLERSDPPADTTIERPKAPDRDAVDRVESVPHVVQKGENFWTISRLSYGSGRFYKALWAANQGPGPGHRRAVRRHDHPDPAPRGTRPVAHHPGQDDPARAPGRAVLAGPPDVAIDPRRGPGRAQGDRGAPARRPVLPAGSTSAEEVDPEPEVGVRPRLPVYRIRANETLRSIANRTLGDSHRDDEILELNRTVIKDPHDLTPGQEIKLPADARVGRRAR